MADDIENKASSEGDIFADALGELVKLIKPDEAYNDLYSYFYYIILLWAPFRIYQVEPFYSNISEGNGEFKVQTINLGNGRCVLDYGYMLATSPGEDYGGFSTGKLLSAIQAMVNMMVERGATVVGVAGHEVAKRAAWMQCLDRGIDVCNFEPTFADMQLYNRIGELREGARS